MSIWPYMAGITYSMKAYLPWYSVYQSFWWVGITELGRFVFLLEHEASVGVNTKLVDVAGAGVVNT